MAILRFARHDGSGGLVTKLITTTKALETLEADLDSDTMHRLVGIQMYSHELATPQSGVFHCNYSCDSNGKTKYTSVALRKWPEVAAKDEEDSRTEGETPEEEDKDIYAPVQPWRHNTMIQAIRGIVSFSEKTTNHSISSLTLEFMFDPATAQPVMMGVVSMASGGNLREKDDVPGDEIAVSRKGKVKKRAEAAPEQEVEVRACELQRTSTGCAGTFIRNAPAANSEAIY